MEESSDVHMETDVSSTTEDVPEAQEVTGSNGNVEMIVIVEKVTDDESTCSSVDQGSKQSATDSDMVVDSNPDVSQAETQKTPPALTSEKSPTKHSEAQKSPLKHEHSYNKEPLDEKPDASSPSIFQSDETVDSSCKVDVQKSPKKSITPKKLSPVKDFQKQSPVKDAQVQKTPQTTPIKEQPQESKKPTPKKDGTPEKPAMNGNAENVSIEKEESNSSQSVPVEIVIIEKEASNDSQMETNSDVTEKEHNKSISRELKSLIKSAKESKIISECTQLTTKTRKSRVPLDASNSSLNVSLEADKIHDVRRSSINSQKSNCSEKSEKVPVKRSMRSQNPEFVNKVKQFLNSVTSKVQKESDDGTDDDSEDKKVKDTKNETITYLPKKKKVAENEPESSNKLKTDPYCWRCHWAVEQAANEKNYHPPLACTVCPRAFHYKCLSGAERSKISTEKSWVCPECMAILHAESSETRSLALKKISLGTLCDLLRHALERMMDLNGVEPFMQPVDRNIFPDYDKYIVHPMDLTQMKTNINDGVYGSTEAFLADAQWILHNSIIFNTCEQGFVQSKLTAAARTLLRSCRAEMGEIEACPECYAAAHARKPTWFTDVCTTPHMLLWAKLKGFPYWPAKGMTVNNSGLVDVRFFGAHDRAWVPAKDCFLYSEKDPNNFRTKRQDILDSMQEAEQHIRSISRKYGKFVYPPFKTQFDPSKLTEQLKMMIPSFEGEVRGPVKEKQVSASPSLVKDKRSSKSSKGSFNDGEVSEGEDISNTSRKMADGAHIARIEDDASEKDKSMDVDAVKEGTEKPEKTSRKRRRSEMEEAVFTIMDNNSKEKKKKINNESESKSSTPAPNKDESSTTVTSKEELKATPKEVAAKEKFETPPATSKDNEPSSSTPEKEKTGPKLTPIRLVISANQKRVVAKTTGRGSPKVLPIKIKQTKLDKSIIITKVKTSKDDKSKSQKRRNSKSNKSLNSSSPSATLDKTDKKTEKTVEIDKSNKKENATNKSKDDANKSITEKANSLKPNTDSPKSKDRIQFDDDISLAEIARGANKISVTNSNLFGLPTISSVRSLSTTAQNTSTSTTKSTTSAKTYEVTIEPSSASSLLTPTTVVRNLKDIAKTSEPSLVGRVGVRAFARMTSPEPQKNKEVEVEIKAEPIDFDDQDRQLEKLDMMKEFKLKPVNQAGQGSQPATSLREVRINKVVMTPLNARKTATKAVEVRPRARKTFPQPKKPDDGRSELNGKNSMVYIPIQPPMTPGPPRGRPTVSAANGPVIVPPGPRPTAPIITSTSNNIVNTVSTSLVPTSVPPLINASSSLVPSSSSITSTPLPLVQVGQLPTTVHRVPLITSVNGQWTFSLQPIMSVGGIDDSPTPPLLNGLPERTNSMTVTSLPPGPSIPTVVPGPTVVTVPGPNAGGAALPALVPTTTTSPGTKTTECNTVNPGEPPRLQQRPSLMNPFDSQTPIGSVPPPSSVGPVTAKLNQNAVKLTDFFRTLLEDSLEKLDDPSTQLASLRLKSEQMNWRHQQEMEELKHNHELVLAEMRTSFEKEKARLTSELRRAAQAELEAAVKQAKGKQWCANCYQEAQFYCCWNTSYCDYPCQRAHWAQHYAVCTQQRAGDTANNPNDAPGSRLQPQPDNIPKCTKAPSSTPTLTVGGKIAQPRPAQESSAVPKSSSIIMSMVEDKTGNQTMKCVGVFKPPVPGGNQVAPIVINNQVTNKDESTANKVVTSGGYLIVGGSTTNQVTTPPRRTHTIQYYT